MFEITKEITIEELLAKIEEANNIGICAFVFALVAIVIIVMLVCAFFEIDKMNDKKIANLQNLYEKQLEDYKDLANKVRFYCNSVIYLKSNDVKKGKKK